MPRVLLTGFAPFDGEPVNAAWEAVRSLEGAVLDGHRVVTRCLPTVFAEAPRALTEALHAVEPAAVIAVGESREHAGIVLERVAINLIDARIADNAGAQPVDVPVVADGPAAYFGTLPIRPMLAALRAAGLPAEVSHSAGTYVCNQVFYTLCHALRARPPLPAGFVHVPLLDTQAHRHANAPSMPLDDVVEALGILVRCALEASAAVSRAGADVV